MRFLTILIVLITTTVYGQSDLPFKGANRIVFVCSDSTMDLYQRLGQHLISKGYSIEPNKDFLNIKTKDREMSKYSFTFRINSVIQHNRILVTMDISGTVLGTSATIDWEYSKASTNTNKIVHDDFIRSMEGFDRTNVYYEKY